MEESQCVLLDTRMVVKEEITEEPVVSNERIIPKEELMPEEIRCKQILVKHNTITHLQQSDKVIPKEFLRTSSNFNTVIKDEFTDESTIIKNEVSLNESTPTSSCVHSVIKEELIIQDEQQLLEERTSSGIDTLINEDILQKDACYGTSGSKEDRASLSETRPVSAQKYKCATCNKAFNLKSTLGRHILIHSDVRKLQCDVCDKAFFDKRSLKKHELIHSDIKKHQCDVCNKAYAQKYNLSIHKLTHTGVNKYVCDVCKKAFSRKSTLARHLLIHSSVKKHECDVCGKAFALKFHLSIHKLTHTGVKKYVCDVCSKAFVQKSHLSIHKLTHTGVNKYECGVCNKVFTLKSTLAKHIFLKHTY